jgi:hypothetical protein
MISTPFGTRYYNVPDWTFARTSFKICLYSKRRNLNDSQIHQNYSVCLSISSVLTKFKLLLSSMNIVKSLNQKASNHDITQRMIWWRNFFSCGSSQPVIQRKKGEPQTVKYTQARNRWVLPNPMCVRIQIHKKVDFVCFPLSYVYEFEILKQTILVFIRFYVICKPHK